MIPFDRETRDRAEQIGFGAMRRQMLDRLADEETGLLARQTYAPAFQEEISVTILPRETTTQDLALPGLPPELR